MEKKISEENLDLIRQYYTISQDLIKLNLKHKARHEIYNAMPVNLYDLSLDILNNRNSTIKDPKLKELIEEVNNNL